MENEEFVIHWNSTFSHVLFIICHNFVEKYSIESFWCKQFFTKLLRLTYIFLIKDKNGLFLMKDPSSFKKVFKTRFSSLNWPTVTYLEFFGGQTSTYIETMKAPWLALSGKFSKFVCWGALKMHSPALWFLRFLCKFLCKSLKFYIMKHSSSWMILWKYIYSYGIQIKYFYGCKLLKAVKGSEKMQQLLQKEVYKAV